MASVGPSPGKGRVHQQVNDRVDHPLAIATAMRDDVACARAALRALALVRVGSALIS